MSNLTHRTIYSSTFNFRLQLLLHVCTVDKIEEILISWNLLSTICMSRAVVICCSIERYASDDTMPRKMVTIIVTCAALGNILSLPSTSRHRADSCTNNESTPNTRPSNSKDGDFVCSLVLDSLLHRDVRHSSKPAHVPNRRAKNPQHTESNRICERS